MKRFEDGTFGSFEEYGCLVMICDRMENKLTIRESEYLSNFLHNFNTHINNIEIKDEHTHRFVLECVRKEYVDRLSVLNEKYDPYLVSHISNYVITRIRKEYEKL